MLAGIDAAEADQRLAQAGGRVRDAIASIAEGKDIMEPVWAVGLMTGTVLDGNIDIALIRTDGERVPEFGPWTLAPYQPDTRSLLARALTAARDWQFAGPEPAVFHATPKTL